MRPASAAAAYRMREMSKSGKSLLFWAALVITALIVLRLERLGRIEVVSPSSRMLKNAS
jgi:hypothetical protein